MSDGCTCTPYPSGNRGCAHHDAALNRKTDPKDRDYEDMRLRLGGPSALAVKITPPEVLVQCLANNVRRPNARFRLRN